MPFRENDRISLTISEEGIAHVRLTRPDKLNALDYDMLLALDEVGAALFEQKGLRAVVLSGEGKAFCAGLDLAAMANIEALLTDPLDTRTHGNANIFQQVAIQWRKLPVPVIAALQGVCFGGGLQIASGADIRIAHPDTRMAIMEMKWGIVPDMGGFALWRTVLRDDVLRELVYTNREFSGAEAAIMGLVTATDDDPLARAKAMAAEIARRNPQAIRAAKRLANSAADERADALLLEESREQQALLNSANQREAVMAQLEKRRPQFSDM